MGLKVSLFCDLDIFNLGTMRLLYVSAQIPGSRTNHSEQSGRGKVITENKNFGTVNSKINTYVCNVKKSKQF